MKRARLSAQLIKAIFIGIVWVVCTMHSPTVNAQTAEFTQNSKNSNSMNFEVPLGNYPGRGISLPVTLRYSSQHLWRIGFINSVYPNNPHVPRSVAEAI